MKQERPQSTLRRRILHQSIAAFLFFILMAPQAHAQTGAVVYLDSLRQVIRGFGAANIRPWRPDMTAGEIQTAFGTGPGQLGFSILRLRVPSATTEFALNLPTAQAAYNMGVTIMASPWSPPAAMKTSNNIVGGELYDTSYASYAAHLKSFVDYMAANGVPLYAVSVQNEPDITVTYESCDWTSAQMLKFVKEQGNAVATKLMAPESYNFNPTIANAILNDSAATANIDIIAGHIYGGGRTPYPLAAQKGKELWMTEYLINSPGSGANMDTSWQGAMATAVSIHDVMNAGMNAYIWWYIVRYYGPIADGERLDPKGSVTKKGYAMSQFARFIRPGYQRVLSWVPRGMVSMTAYKSNSKVIVVALNSDTSSVEQTVTLQNLAAPMSVSALTPYVTSATKNCEAGTSVAVSKDSFTATLDASSITTFVGDIVVGVEEEPSVPRTTELFQNYPNPFNPETAVSYQLSEATAVRMSIFDLLGREVDVLVDEVKGPGVHKVVWNASHVPSGMYFCRLLAGSYVGTRKMLLLR